MGIAGCTVESIATAAHTVVFNLSNLAKVSSLLCSDGIRAVQSCSSIAPAPASCCALAIECCPDCSQTDADEAEELDDDSVEENNNEDGCANAAVGDVALGDVALDADVIALLDEGDDATADRELVDVAEAVDTGCDVKLALLLAAVGSVALGADDFIFHLG